MVSSSVPRPEERRAVAKQAGSAWTARELVAGVFFVLFLTVQLMVPLALLFGPRPSRFGWQMFSAARTPPAFTLVIAGGETVAAPPLRIGVFRSDLNYVRHGPPYLCTTRPDIVAVRFDGGEHSCR